MPHQLPITVPRCLEVPCLARVGEGKTKSPLQLWGRRQVSVNTPRDGPHLGLPKPPEERLGWFRKMRGIFTAPTSAALLLEPVAGGHKLWLFLSISLDPVPPSTHQFHLRLHEPRCIPHWLPDTTSILLWDNRSNFRLIRATLPKKSFAPIWKTFGPPDTAAYWISSRLLPRRVPAATRVLSPTHIQLFLHL